LEWFAFTGPKSRLVPDAALDAFQQGGHFRSRHDFLTLTKSFSICSGAFSNDQAEHRAASDVLSGSLMAEYVNYCLKVSVKN